MHHPSTRDFFIPFACCVAAMLSGCASSRDAVQKWQDIGGPAGCDVSFVLPDESAPGMAYAGLISGAVYRSPDRGRTWVLAGMTPGDGAVNALVQDPERRRRLFAATGAGAFLSEDSGATWKDLRLGGETGTSTLSFAIDPWKTSVLYAGTRGRGMFRSSDGGGSWNPVVIADDSAFQRADVWDIEIDLQKPDILYAAVSSRGVMRSTDAGKSWTRLTPEVTRTGSQVTCVLLNRSTGNDILYGTTAGAIFRTTDGGTTWSRGRAGLEIDRILSLEHSGVTPEIVLAGTTNGAIRSADFGATWFPLDERLPRVPTAVALPRSAQDPTVFLYGEGIGVLASVDSGKSWDHPARGPGGSTVTRILADRSGKRVFAATGSSVFRYDMTSRSWTAAGSGLTGGRIEAFALDSDSASLMYAATPAGIYLTRNAGESWRATPRRLSVAPVFLDTHPSIGTRILASGERGLFVSTDRGESWAQVMPLGNRFSVRSLTFAPANAGIIFGAGPGGVIGTSDGGFSWTAMRIGTGSEGASAVTLGTTDGQVCYAWLSGGKGFKSANLGLTWEEAPTPWPKDVRLTMASDRFRPADAVALINGDRLYHTTDGGETWTPVPGVAIPFEITSLHWNAGSGTLTAGTKGMGVRQLPVVSSLPQAQ